MQIPLAPGGMRGLARCFTLQVTLGASLLSGLCHALVIAGIIGVGIQSLRTGQSLQFIWPILITTGLNYSVNIAIGALGLYRAGKSQLLWSVPFMPFYWLVLIVPSWMAIIDLFTDPYNWRKTTHGVTHMRPTTQSEVSIEQNTASSPLVITPSHLN